MGRAIFNSAWSWLSEAAICGNSAGGNFGAGADRQCECLRSEESCCVSRWSISMLTLVRGPNILTRAMTSHTEATERNNDSAVMGFCFVWIAGLIASLLSFRLVFSGTLWDWAIPAWLINFILLIGIWQWIWVTPLLAYASRTNRPRLYKGLRRGAIWFTLLQLSLCTAIYFSFRHFRFQ